MTKFTILGFSPFTIVCRTCISYCSIEAVLLARFKHGRSIAVSGYIVLIKTLPRRSWYPIDLRMMDGKMWSLRQFCLDSAQPPGGRVRVSYHHQYAEQHPQS